MRYVKLENNTPINYSIEQLLLDYPEASIYKGSQLPNEELLSHYNVYPLITTPLPDLLEDELAEEGLPVLIDNEWHQTWVARKMTAEEINTIVNSNTDIPENIVYSQDNQFFTDQDTSNGRYEICQTCPSFTILKTCKECGCIMPLKVRLKSSECPLGKW